VPFSGNEPDRGVRLYVQEVEGGKPKAITPEGMHASAFLVSPDGQSVAGIGPDQLGYIYPNAGGEGRWKRESNPSHGRRMGFHSSYTAQGNFRPRSRGWSYPPDGKLPWNN
jgi:hypothetical protein